MYQAGSLPWGHFITKRAYHQPFRDILPSSFPGTETGEAQGFSEAHPISAVTARTAKADRRRTLSSRPLALTARPNKKAISASTRIEAFIPANVVFLLMSVADSTHGPNCLAYASFTLYNTSPGAFTVFVFTFQSGFARAHRAPSYLMPVYMIIEIGIRGCIS